MYNNTKIQMRRCAMKLSLDQKNSKAKRVLCFVLAFALLLGCIPPKQMAVEVSAAETVEVDTTPVYSDYIFDQLRDAYIYNTDITTRTTVYASAAILYQETEGSDNAVVTWGTSYHPGDIVNLRPSVKVYGAWDQAWTQDFEMYDWRLLAERNNPDVQMRFGGTFTSTKNNKPSMTVNGVSIGSNMAKKSTQALEGVATFSETITVSGGAGTSVTGMWAAMIDNTSAVPVTSGITAWISWSDGAYLNLKIPMDENLRWANKNAGSYGKDISVKITLYDVLTGKEDTENPLTLTFCGIDDDWRKDALLFSTKLSSKWANGHFTLGRIVGANMNTVTDIPFEVYGMLGCKTHDVGLSQDDDYGNASRYITDIKLETTPITDRAGNRVDLSGLKNVNLQNVDFRYDNVDPKIIKIYVAEAEGIESLSLSRTAGSADSWPEDIDRSQLFLANGNAMTFAAVIDEPVLLDVNVASSNVYALLNVLDINGQQVKLKLASRETVAGTRESKLEGTQLTFEPFVSAQGMTMMAGHEGSSIQIVGFSGAIRDSAGNILSQTVLAPEEKIYLDAQAPNVTVQRIENAGTGANTLELQITVSDKNGAMNAGIQELSNEPNLWLWITGAGTENLNYQYTLTTYPTASGNTKTGSGILSSQKTDAVIAYTTIAQEEITLKLTLTFDDNAAVDALTLHAQAQDVADNIGTYSFDLAYKLDQIAPVLNVGAASYTFTTDTAAVAVPVTAEDANSQVAKLEYQWTNAGAAYTDDWEVAPITQGKSVSYTVRKTYSDAQNHQQTLWIRATDTNGRVTEVRSVDVTVNLEQPATSYSYENRTDLPQADPVVKVNGPAARKSDAAAAYTRISVTMGGNTYVRVVKTGESIDVFDFDGTWYQVTKNGSTFASVTEVSADVLKNYYGPVTVTFENAFTDLTPVKNGAIAPAGVGYVADTVELRLFYAPDQATAIHSATFTGFYDPEGDAIEGTGTMLFLNSMSGVRIDFSLGNLLLADWGISDIDFEKSYLEFTKVGENGSEVMVRSGLQGTASQSFTVPYRTDAGESFETGKYQLTVYIVKRDGRTDAYTFDRSLVLDATTPENYGLWEYSVKDGAWYDAAAGRTAEDAPITSFGMAMGVEQEIYRDDMFAYYTNGVDQMTITLKADENVVTYDGIAVGQVEGFRLWPMDAGLTQEQIDALGFAAPNYREDGQAEYVATYGVTLVDSYPQGTDGVLRPGGKMLLVRGANVICYQVKMANGSVSAVGQFTIFVTEQMPILDVSVESITQSMIASEIPGQINVKDITLSVDSAFSVNGSGQVTVTLESYGNVLVNGQTAESGALLQPGDKITLNDDTYTGEYTESISSKTKTLLILRDEYGGTMIVAPQIGSEYRIDGDHAVNYQDYPLGPSSDTQYGISYNEPQYDDDGNITGYRTYDIWETKLGVDRTTEATLDYNRYAINTDEPDIYGSGYIDRGAYQEVSFSVDHPEYIDWNSITLTLPTLDGGTVDVPVNYSGVNDAGFILAEYDEYANEFVVLVANPVDDEKAGTDAFGYTSFQIHYKDVTGEQRMAVGGYILEYVSGQPRGSTSSTGYALYMPTAVFSAEPEDVSCYYNDYAGRYNWEINTGVYNAEVYSGSYTDMFGKTHTFTVNTEAWEDGLDIQVSPTTPTGGSVTVVIRSTLGEAITVDEGNSGQTVTGNGTSEVTVTVTENGYVSYQTATIGRRSVEIENIYDPDLQVLWSYDVEQVSVDDAGVAYHYGPVTAYLISGDDRVEVLDNYTGNVPSFTFYPGEATSYTFRASDLSVMVGTEKLECQDFTVTLEVELRNYQNPVEEDAIRDDIAPAVQLRTYTQQNGLFADAQKLLQVGKKSYMEGMLVHADDEVFATESDRADTEGFIAALGWASALRFQIDVQDDSKVKLFIKDGLYAAAPDYTSGAGDTVQGVSLNGRILTVSEPAAFTLFVVDAEGNVTTIPMSVSNVGQAPVPRIQKIPGKQAIYAYLLPPEGVEAGEMTDLKLTFPTSAAQATEGDYAGYWYAPLTSNGVHTLNYSYTYQGKTVTGSLVVEVTELDTTPIELEKDGITWSANKARPATNQNVTVQLRFTKDVSEIQVPAAFVDRMEVLITGRCVTVRYDEDMDAVDLIAVATNGTRVVVPLDAVTNIDKTAPEAQVVEQTLSQDGKTVTVIFQTNEAALLRETGNYGEENRYSREHKENGTYTACFIDLAGNITQIEYRVDTIMDTPLRLLFNTEARNTGAVEDPDGISLTIGDTVYVKPNRDCTVTMNGEQEKTVQADAWVGFTISENDAGLWPIIHAVDAFGNTAAGQFGGVKLPDRTAPVLTLRERVVSVKLGAEESELRRILEENLIVSDLDTNITVTVGFTDAITLPGTSAVTYTAADSAGNQSTITGWLRLTAANEPDVKINGQVVDRDTIYLSDGETLELTVDVYGEPYSVVWKKGVKTVGQMKTGTTDLLRNETAVKAVELPFAEAGYYTVCIRTQGRDEFVFNVYVSAE